MKYLRRKRRKEARRDDQGHMKTGREKLKKEGKKTRRRKKQ